MIYAVVQYHDYSANEYGTSIQLLTTNKSQATAFYSEHKPTNANDAQHWHLVEIEDGQEWPRI